MIVGLIVLGAGVALVSWHMRVWRRWRDEEESPARRHYRGQTIQRCVTSGMIGVVGLLMVASHWVRDPLTLTIGLMVAIGLVLVIFVSAFVDAIRSQRFLIKNDTGIREARDALVAEVERLQKKKRRSRSRKNNRSSSG